MTYIGKVSGVFTKLARWFVHLFPNPNVSENYNPTAGVVDAMLFKDVRSACECNVNIDVSKKNNIHFGV